MTKFPSNLDNYVDFRDVIDADAINAIEKYLLQGPTGYFAQGGGPIWDISHPTFGAKGDCRFITDANINSASSVMTSASQANFTQADVGKRVDINGAISAGTNGAVFTATINSVQNANSCTLSSTAALSVTNAAANIGTDNQLAIQAAINKQQTLGGRVKCPLDQYGGLYLTDPGLIAAPGSRAGGFTTATRPLLIEGDGMLNTSIVAGGPNTFSGLIGYQNVIQAQVVMSDITLDGNYLGAGGVLPQPTSSASALVGQAWPYTNAFSSPAQNGIYHIFTRVRFYRPAAFTFQPCQGIELHNCLFDKVGQPDVASGGLHWDNLGSSQGDAQVIACTWKDSSGNYADFVDATGGAGHIIRLIMIGCVSFNHQIGGIYAAGTGSIFIANRFKNNVAGSGLGYDSSTNASMRSKNIAIGNILDNINMNTGNPLDYTKGDISLGNHAADANQIAVIQGVLDLSANGGNVNAVTDGVNGNLGTQAFGDKLIIGGTGQGNHAGIGYQSGAMVFIMPNAGGQKWSYRVDPAGTAAASSGSEAAYLDTGGNLGLHGTVPLFNNIATQGLGHPAIYQAPAPTTGSTAAIASIATLTSPNDGAKHVYEVSGTITITVHSSESINLEVSYTDDNGVAHTSCMIPLCAQAGTYAAAANTADNWKGHITISVNPNTAITVKTAGTFTGATYNVSAQIKQIL